MVLITTEGHVWRLQWVVMEQSLWTITRHCNLEKPSGCLKLLTRSYCLLLALETNRAVPCSHFCFSLLGYKQALEKEASISQICRHRWSETQHYGMKPFGASSHVQKHSPELNALACSATPGRSWVPQLWSRDICRTRRKTRGHSQPFTHSGKSLATKHWPAITPREFIGSGRHLVHLEISQLSLQLQSGF